MFCPTHALEHFSSLFFNEGESTCVLAAREECVERGCDGGRERSGVRRPVRHVHELKVGGGWGGAHPQPMGWAGHMLRLMNVASWLASTQQR